MFDPLLNALIQEINSAQSGSDQGQFPILDLLGNLRDQATKKSDWKEFHALFAQAWDKMVRIVESGKPFSKLDITWLQDLLVKIQPLTGVTSPAPPPSPISLPPVSTPAPGPHEPEQELALALNITSDGDLLREFITESREHLDNIEQGTLVLENEPGNQEVLSTIFRAFHTFKGGAGFLNLVPINRLAHILESLLDLARQGKLTIDITIVELILQGRDTLKQYIDEIEAQVNGSRPVAPILIPTVPLKKQAQAVIDAVNSGKTLVSAPVVTSTTKTVSPVSSERSSAIKVDTEKLDALLDLVGEMVIAQSLVQNRAEMINVRGRLIPLIRLHQLFAIEAKTTDPTQGIVLVVASGINIRGILVDALLHKQEVVIKNVNEMMAHKNPAFAGATILGDGRVGLILDVNALAS